MFDPIPGTSCYESFDSSHFQIVMGLQAVYIQCAQHLFHGICHIYLL